MRRILASCLLLAITLPCQAQGDKAKPNTLSAKEIADGWILLFDGETTFGWEKRGLKPTVKVKDGALDLSKTGPGGRMKTTSAFLDFEVTFEYYLGAEQGYVEFHSADGGMRIPFPKTGKWTRFTAKQSDNFLHFDHTDGKPLKVKTSGASSIEFNFAQDLKLRNIKLRPLNTKSLFNGKDLTGWKEFPGRKSKFTVTDKGEINVKDGNGDLQTVGKYKDFLLQLECISNGKHLNSGIFFRCKDNEYQNGYEAQILNKFTAEATQDYTIEEYDPQTNKLLAKNKIKATAVDFGTGAIYRRVPARKEMSKDGEWFGMTIVAHGNHFATWVNGVQVTDWYDNRSKSDNPRNGFRPEAGHISIQGHDPTTNLSFKNIRIAELPAAK
jgi:Domain of Unknown Function (DUF1080)